MSSSIPYPRGNDLLSLLVRVDYRGFIFVGNLVGTKLSAMVPIRKLLQGAASAGGLFGPPEKTRDFVASAIH